MTKNKNGEYIITAPIFSEDDANVYASMLVEYKTKDFKNYIADLENRYQIDVLLIDDYNEISEILTISGVASTNFADGIAFFTSLIALSTASKALIDSLVNDKLNIPNCPVLIVASSHPFSKSTSRYSFES